MKKVKDWISSITRMKTQQKIITIYLIGGLIPMILISIFLVDGNKKNLIEQAKVSEQAELSLIKESLKEDIRIIKDVSKRMYFDEELEKIAFKNYTDYAELIEDYRSYDTMANYMSYYNRIIQSISMYIENDSLSSNARFVMVTDQITNEDWYQDTLNEEGRVLWIYKYNELKWQNGLYLSRLIRTKESKVVGILNILMRDETLQTGIRMRKNETVISLNGDTLIASNKEETDEEAILTLLKENEGMRGSKRVNYKGEDCVLTIEIIEDTDTISHMTIASIQPYRTILAEANERSRESVRFIIFSICVSVVLISVFSYHFSHQLNKFRLEMHKAANGDFNIAKKLKGNDEIADLYDNLNVMINSMQQLLVVVYEEQLQKEKLKSRQKEVEFKMLANQINPHFLYNTLETIRMKARCNNELEIEELVKMLAKIMRRNIEVGDTLVSFKSELDLMEYYLKIQQYRFGDRIQYKIDVCCDISNYKIMPLIIQPIVENAFVHGLESKEGNGIINVIIDKSDKLYIYVKDNGVGISNEVMEEIENSLNDYSISDQTHIGLNNVNQRIKLLYGEEYGLRIKSDHLEGTTVTIELPLNMDS